MQPRYRRGGRPKIGRKAYFACYAQGSSEAAERFVKGGADGSAL
jgi:hypothetical protein